MSTSTAEQLQRLGYRASTGAFVVPKEKPAWLFGDLGLPPFIQPTCGFVVTAKAIDPLVNPKRNLVEADLRRELASARGEVARLYEANETQAQIIRALSARLTAHGN
jgi:hypothetical protein